MEIVPGKQKRKEKKNGTPKKGIPKKVLFLCPIEVLRLVDALPYCLINRHDGKHAFWTALGSIANLKDLLEKALEVRDCKFLGDCLTQLKAGRINQLLSSASKEAQKNHIPVDLRTLDSETFKVFDPIICKEKFCELLLNQVFLLKYKLVVEEEKDKPYRVEFREPPKIVYSHADGRWQVGYDEEDFAKLDSPVDLFDLILPGMSPEKRKHSFFFDSPSKKVKMTDAELTTILAEAATMYQGMHEPVGNELELGATQTVENDSLFCLDLNESDPSNSTITLNAVGSDAAEPSLSNLHLHLHLSDENRRKKIVTYEVCSQKMLKVTVEEAI